APGSVAALWDAEVLTYSALNGAANQFARYLRSAGVTPGTYVPVIMTRTMRMLIAQLAVLKCGGVYVPVDPDLPVERRRFIVQDCRTPVVVAHGSGYADLDLDGVRAIDWTDVADAVKAQPDA